MSAPTVAMSSSSHKRSSLQGSVAWRLDQLKTLLLRAVQPRVDDATRLHRRIDRRIRQLGRHYEDGNSALVGYTYHPIPFSGFSDLKSHRRECENRLEAILSVLKIRPGDWILDVGANVGFFAFNLEARGAIVEAYEFQSDTFEIGAALSRLHDRDVIYVNKLISNRSVPYLRSHYRAVLLLSVFHWIMKQEGEGAATELLRELARRADYLFFEVPSRPDEAMVRHQQFVSQESIERYLESALPEARLTLLLTDHKWGGRLLYAIDCRED